MAGQHIEILASGQVRGIENWGQCEIGEPAGLLIPALDYAETRARLDAGEQLFVRAARP